MKSFYCFFLYIMLVIVIDKVKVGSNVGFREDYLFWRILKTLIQNHGYSIITMSDRQNEVWLESNKREDATVLRFMRHDFDWANVLKHDLHRTAFNGENIRKQLFRKPITIINTYITQYKPVDEYETYIKNPLQNKKTKIESLLVDSESLSGQLSELERKIGFPVVEAEDIPADIEEDDVLNLKKSVLNAAVQKKQEEQKIFQHGKPLFTKIFLAIQVAVFIMMEIMGSSESTITLVEFGAKYNPLILEGEWWRFITPVFIHIGILHLLMNSVALYYLGAEVEKIYGSIRFFFIYLFAGFAGVLSSFIFSTGNLSAGASGAIFGCFGALLYFGIMKPKLFLRTMGTNIMVLLLINLVFGFMVSGVDNAGHLGGLIGGFLATAAVGLPKKMKPIYNVAAALLIVIGSAVLLKYGFETQMKNSQDIPLASLASAYIEKGETEKAKSLLLSATDNGIPSSSAYFMLGNLSIDDKQYKKAKEYFETAVKLNPQFHQAHYNLALIYLQEEDVMSAKEHVEAALKLQPREDAYKQLDGQIDDYIKRSE